MTAPAVRRPPKGDAWIRQIFDKQALLDPDGIVFRRASSVERHASHGLLLLHCGKRGFDLTRIGTHYLIHRPGVEPAKCIASV